jgi:hypothetical protein
LNRTCCWVCCDAVPVVVTDDDDDDDDDDGYKSLHNCNPNNPGIIKPKLLDVVPPNKPKTIDIFGTINANPNVILVIITVTIQ